MPVESDDDLLIFLNPDEFGVEAVYVSRDATVEPKPIPGHFDDEGSNWNPSRWNGTEYQMQMGASITSSGPTFLCRTSDLLKGGRKGEKLTIKDRSGAEQEYRIEDKRPDGTGLSLLLLMAND
ncbi:head-tail joining protein [Bradyrhizobium sp. SZCCHNR1045]|uniref:head-tail joining protein n=1 Tax=unclassified Bradyrhizobium TaxID=2631580 RepID=UPI002915E522|nr:head-tail joining protein [Bradyrhizobium sp. SZCCHNR1045]